MHEAQAGSVYRCLDAQGQLAYQDRACAGTQQETRIELAALPPAAASPDYGRGVRERTGAPGRPGERKRLAGRILSRRPASREPTSYECRAANGEVFYKHATCPKSIRVRATARGGRRAQATQTEAVAVSASALPRAEACRRLAASPVRSGHERDDQVSTYERNLGRDPCRRL
ncbi:MAG TPA: DUF4124 domain-containing protein [Dokdonella sp.]